MGTKKIVDVTAHVRKGKAVKAHDRVIDTDSTDDLYGLTDKDLGGPLLEMAQPVSEKTIKTISGVTYQGRHLGEGLAEIQRIENCIFDSVTFTPMDFKNVEFVGCTFDGCVFRCVDFKDCEIRDCSFNNTEFSGKESESPWEDTNFIDCSFNSSKFLGVGMLYGGFKGCSFENFGINGSKLNNIQILNSSIKNCKVMLSDLSNTLFDQCHFENFIMDNVARRERKGRLGASSGKDGKLFIHRSSLNGCSIQYVKMNGSKIIRCELNDVRFGQVQLEKLQFYNSAGSNISFDVCNMNNADFELSKFKAVAFNKTSMHYSSWRDASLDCEFESNNISHYYKQHSFEETFEESGLTKERFEFLVLAGAIEVRDNESLQKVSGGFDPDKHHIPPWVHENIKSRVNNLSG